MFQVAQYDAACICTQNKAKQIKTKPQSKAKFEIFEKYNVNEATLTVGGFALNSIAHLLIA